MGGVGAIDYESNMYAGPDDDNKRHQGLGNSPEKHSAPIPILGIDLRYTFADTQTQIFLGNLIQDAVRFDFTQQAGVRQQWDEKGIFSLGYVFPLMPSKSWADPYTSDNRDETDIKSGGGRISWEQILGTDLNASYTQRSFDVNDEKSGQSLPLTPDERELLNRNGKVRDMALSYDLLFAPGYVFEPEFIYTRAELDGKAMSYDKTAIHLSYGYNNPQWSIATNFFGALLKYDESNPIYNRKADATEFGVSTTFFWHRLAGITGLNAFIGASYSKSDSDIDFYDSSVTSMNTGILYHF